MGSELGENWKLENGKLIHWIVTCFISLFLLSLLSLNFTILVRIDFFANRREFISNNSRLVSQSVGENIAKKKLGYVTYLITCHQVSKVYLLLIWDDAQIRFQIDCYLETTWWWMMFEVELVPFLVSCWMRGAGNKRSNVSQSVTWVEGVLGIRFLPCFWTNEWVQSLFAHSISLLLMREWPGVTFIAINYPLPITFFYLFQSFTFICFCFFLPSF